MRVRLRLRERSDRGASAAEYAGLIVLAALIIGALVPLIPGKIGEVLPNAICKILNITDAGLCKRGTPGADGQKIDINPQRCLSSMHVDDSNVNVSYMLFSIGEGYKVVRYDSREEDVDGKVKHFVYLAFVNKGDVGIDYEKAKNGKKIDIGGGVEVAYGDMYRLTPDEAKKFTDKINEYQAELLAQRTSGNPYTAFGQWVYHKIKGEDWPPDIPDPAITYGEVSGTTHGEGSLPINLDKKLTTPSKYVIPNGGTASTTQNKMLTTEHWYIYRDAKGNILPATATYHMNSGTYTIGASRKAEKKGKSGRSGSAEGNASVTWDYSNTTRITRDDKTGKLRSIRYVITYGNEGSLGTEFGITGKDRGKGKKDAGLGYSDTHSDGKLHTEVIQINFDLNNDQEQQVGENWLKNHGLEMPPTVANQVFPKTGETPGIPDDKPDAAAPGPDADPFDQLIYARAMGWKTDADTKAEAKELNAMLPLGRGIGIDIQASSKDSRTQRAQILDAPGSDGKRHWIDYPDCTAAGNK